MSSGPIASKLTRLNNARLAIIQVLTDRHVDATGHGFEDFATDISSMDDNGLIVPIAYDAHNGYVSSGTFTYEDAATTPCRLDVYFVETDKQYLIALGGTVGTRFRCMWSEEDTSVLTSGSIRGTNILNFNNPPPYRTLMFTPTVDCYVTIQKDNLSVSGLKTYVYDISRLCP